LVVMGMSYVYPDIYRQEVVSAIAKIVSNRDI